MKIETSDVRHLSLMLKGIVGGIPEIIQMGDDGFESAIIGQCSIIDDVINKFITLHLDIAPPTKNKVPSYVLWREKEYYNFHEAEEQSQGEQLKMFKAECYFFIKKALRESDKSEVIGLKNSDLKIYLELLVQNTHLQYSAYSKYVYAFDDVIEDIMAEMIEDRRKNPQLNLF